FDGLDISLLVESFKEFSIGGVLLFILSTPIILVTLVMKNYVPTIIFTVVITLINVMGGSSEHRALFPWARSEERRVGEEWRCGGWQEYEKKSDDAIDERQERRSNMNGKWSKVC